MFRNPRFTGYRPIWRAWRRVRIDKKAVTEITKATTIASMPTLGNEYFLLMLIIISRYADDIINI